MEFTVEYSVIGILLTGIGVLAAVIRVLWRKTKSLEENQEDLNKFIRNTLMNALAENSKIIQANTDALYYFKKQAETMKAG